MNIVRYRQWPAQAAFQNEVKQAFERYFEPDAGSDESAVVTAEWVPQVDIKEEAGGFVIYADLPGMEPSDIDVSMDKGILTIKGERRSESTAEGAGFSRVERRYGSFHRRFALPDSADADGITAIGHLGVLEIVIPKKAETTPRRIQVGAATQAGGMPSGASSSSVQ